MLQMFKNIRSLCVNAVFPLFCIGCEKEGTLLCPSCQMTIAFVKSRCPICRAPSAFGRTCLSHRSHLDGCIAVTSYAHPWVRELIRLWKFEYVRIGESVLLDVLLRYVQESAIPRVDWALVPVPLSPRRFNERGFSQTRDLVEILSALTELPMRDDILRHRRKMRKRQADIPSEEKRRTQNLSTYFFVNTNCVQVPSHVLLIDDVYTTGATMEGAARVLKEAGVKHVWGFVFARNK